MRGLSVEYVPQEPVLEDTSVSEVLVTPETERVHGERLPSEIRGLGAALGLPPATRACSSSRIGERRRVALARALLGRPQLLAARRADQTTSTRKPWSGWRSDCEARRRAAPGHARSLLPRSGGDPHPRARSRQDPLI